jgi:hypothetical protein
MSQLKLAESTTLFTPSEVGPERYEAAIQVDEFKHDTRKMALDEVWTLDLDGCTYIRVLSDKDIGVDVTIGTQVIEKVRFLLCHLTVGQTVVSIKAKEEDVTTKVIAGGPAS